MSRLLYEDIVDTNNLKYKLRIIDNKHISDHMELFINYIKSERKYLEQNAWKEYNIFHIEHPFIEDLRKDVWKLYVEMCIDYDMDPDENVMVNGWVNYLTKGERVKKHYHGKYGKHLFTCVKSLQCSSTDSHTSFHLPIEHGDRDVFDVSNFKGQTIIFPQWLPHSVSSVKEQERITLGIDILDPEHVQSNIDTAPVNMAVPLLKE
jgi:hypothetical protein